MAKSESVTVEQRENLFIEKHAVQFLLRLKATMPELDENTGGEILRGLMESLNAFILRLAEEAEQEAAAFLEARDFHAEFTQDMYTRRKHVAAWLREKVR